MLSAIDTCHLENAIETTTYAHTHTQKRVPNKLDTWQREGEKEEKEKKEKKEKNYGMAGGSVP